MLGRKEKQFVEELTELVGAHYQIHFSQDEKNYLTLQLVGKVYIDSETEQGNFVMQSEIDRLVTEMLEMIYREFHVDFRNDFHLRMELNRHMVPFVLRMKYHMIHWGNIFSSRFQKMRLPDSQRFLNWLWSSRRMNRRSFRF